jgi:hypothetical protein
MKNFILFLFVSFLFSCNSEVSKIPSDISYSIIDEEINESFSKTNINIRLNKRIDEEVLTEIAKELKSARTEYSKVWIFYLLPNMTLGKGAWATTNFAPDLDVKILGCTIEEISGMESTKVTGEILNKWKDYNAHSECIKYLVKEDQILKMKTISCKDGWNHVQVLKETNQNGKIKYEYENDFGEYYLVQKNGILSIFSEDGKFGDLMKIE